VMSMTAALEQVRKLGYIRDIRAEVNEKRQ
jgi:hypothetical protein